MICVIFQAVLNGVEFRTRHTDYSLKRPAKDTSDYAAVDYIDFPEVIDYYLEVCYYDQISGYGGAKKKNAHQISPNFTKFHLISKRGS